MTSCTKIVSEYEHPHLAIAAAMAKQPTRPYHTCYEPVSRGFQKGDATYYSCCEHISCGFQNPGNSTPRLHFYADSDIVNSVTKLDNYCYLVANPDIQLTSVRISLHSRESVPSGAAHDPSRRVSHHRSAVPRGVLQSDCAKVSMLLSWVRSSTSITVERSILLYRAMVGGRYKLLGLIY